MLPRAVQRLAAALGSAVVLVGMTWTVASGQGTTGKIQGRIVMAGTGTPIAAAQVTVEGTTLGNITNDDGFYFINEVPAGVFDIRAQSIGYRATVVRNERVLAGQTKTLNFELEQAAVQLEALEVTGERNPLVPRDQVSSKAIVTGEEIDNLPLDNASSIIVLQPGVIQTNSGRTIRGSRPGEEAVYIDGVPIRRLRTGTVETTELSTNVLAQVDVVTGGIDARYGDAQSGVINYVTRTGGPTFGGTAAFFTDQLAPLDWRGGLQRAELSLGGPIPGVENLTFFMGGTAEGRQYGTTYQNLSEDPGWWYPTGVDTTFRLPRTSAVSGMSDSVDVVVPNYERWENGNRNPAQGDEYNLTAKLTYGLPRGGKVDLTYYRNRNTGLGFSYFNPDAPNASYRTSNVVTLGTYFLLHQTAESQLALDLKASLQRDWNQTGDVTAKWAHDNFTPFMGFRFGGVDFIVDPDDYPVDVRMVNALKSGVLPADSLEILTNRGDLGALQGAQGVATRLRLNPYADRSGASISGVGNTGQSWQKESRLYLSGTADWQINRFNRLWIGGDITQAETSTRTVSLYSGTGGAAIFEPTRAGLYAQNRLDIGDVVLEAGLRYEYFQPDGEWPRTPGYVFNVPDSLTKDLWRLEEYDAGSPKSLLDRVVQSDDCGGAATESRRLNANGQPVCKNNFITTDAKTTWSPRLAVSFPVTATSTFRFSYSHNTQVPALTPTGGIVDAVYRDLQGGGTNTNTLFGRDIDIPRTVLFEAGYRQVFGGNTVVDVAAYSKTTRNSLTYRKVQYADPNTGAGIYINSLTNADYSLARGLDLRLDRRFSDIADLSLNYSFVNAQGTGSDPNTYTGLILRRNTNLSVLTGSPVDPPELLLTLNQSRAHNVSSTFSLLFPADYREDTPLGAVLGDLGLFATMTYASGLPYTRLLNNGDGQIGPPTFAGLGGIPAEQLNASRTPARMNVDLRLVRGFRVGDNRMRLTADMRNPFHIATTRQVWMETGTITNSVHREEYLDGEMRDATLDGDANIDDFDILTESPENALNKYMLLQAERRFGNGDGIYTVEEQRATFTANYLNGGNNPLRFRRADRSLRLGLEFIF